MSDPDVLIKAGVWSPQKVKRLLMQSQSYYLDRRISEEEQALSSIAADPLTLSLLSQSLSSLRSEQQELSNAIHSERKSRLESEDTSSAYFCSHSVAVVLRSLGVLPSSVPATEYLPYSFSSEMNLPLLKGATFSSEVFLRGTKNDLFASTEKIVDELYAMMVKRKSEEEEINETKQIIDSTEQTELENHETEEFHPSSQHETEEFHPSSQHETEEFHPSSQHETHSPPLSISDHPIDTSSSEEPIGPSLDTSPSTETVSVPHRDVTSILSPSDVSYILTQLRLTRPLARASDASLLQLLQHMTMYSPQLSAH